MLPALARSWIATHRGDAAEVQQLRSAQGEVWRVTLADGSRLAVKQASPAVIKRECWGLEMSRTLGSVPSLLARPSADQVVLSWHEGSPSAGADVFRAAGAWLRALHGIGGPFHDALSVRDAIERRRDAWLERARSLLDEDTREKLREAIQPGAFADLERTVCHRDFTPSNWLWNDALIVIDFGQSRPDVSLWDLVKLEAQTFHEDPDVRSMFFDGYGVLGPQEEERLGQLVLLHGLQTAVWGDTHGDSDFSSLGRDILARRLL